jgi:hypothetical protein
MYVNKACVRIIQCSKPSSNAGVSNADSIIRVKGNVDDFLRNAENSIIRDLPHML